MPYDCANSRRTASHGTSGVKTTRPGERVGELERKLSEAYARISALEAICRLNELEPTRALPAWTTGLSGSELGALLAMYSAYPAPLNNYALDDIVPRYDHVEDRDVRGMAVLIHKLRKKVGAENIVNLWGRGYTLSAPFHDRLKAEMGADAPAESRAFKAA